MINPDGVVAGNYRTSLIGKDLNRLFFNKCPLKFKSKYEMDLDERLLPEIYGIKKLI